MKSKMRRLRLYELAEQDPMYLCWKNSFEECTEKFQTYAQQQPKEICSLLYGYADCGRLMIQRILNLACDHMEFPDEKQ